MSAATRKEMTVLGVLAAAVGTDSRDSIGDDWARPTNA